MPLRIRRTWLPATGSLLLAATLVLQTGCRPVREVAPGATAAPPVTTAAPAGYRVVAAESEVRVLVYRDGPMARLGHNHVLRSQALQGDIDLGDKGEDPRISLVVPVASFSVDQADLRQEEGVDFPGVVEDTAIAGTRKNLLSEALLDGAHFPEIRLTSRKLTGSAPDYTMTVAVEVKGQTHELMVPVRVEQRADELRATGAFTATHAELGLAPFTVMGGLLSVRDEIKLRFRIVARP
jgi:polyisoprenoid-binding protein YceI